MSRYILRFIFIDLLMRVSCVLLFLFSAGASFNRSSSFVSQAMAQEFEEEDFDGEEDFEEEDSEDLEEDLDTEVAASEDSGDDETFGDDEDFGSDEDVSFSEFGEDSDEDSLLSAKADEDEISFDDLSEEDELVESNEVVAEPVIPAQETSPPQEVQPVVEARVEEKQYDEPDFSYEKRLHNIYLNYHVDKTPIDQWDAMVGKRRSESYEIQKADTLWDISATFFGDGEYWPKIWSENGKITNPHLISQGNSIVFLMGNENEAPAFTVADSATVKQGEAQEGATTGGEVAVEGPEAVPNSSVYIPEARETVPVINVLPKSIPEWSLIEAGGEAKATFSVNPIKRVPEDKRKIVETYIGEDDPNYIGSIAEIEATETYAVKGQYVFIKSTRNFDLNARERVLVVKNKGEVETVHGDEYQPVASRGFRLLVEGRLEIVDEVETDDGRLYKALVVDSFNPITRGSKLMDKALQKVTMSLDGPRSQVNAQIIGGGLANRRKYFTAGSYAFLNKGQSQGLSNGDILPVYENRTLRKDRVVVKSVKQPVGWLKVVDTTDNYATALILKSWKEIFTGDSTGSTFEF